nr:hypothetical protein [Tanacetum cinerariifolium]
MTTPFTTSKTDSQMHNNIMAAGSRDRPPMLAQEDMHNGDHGPYTPTTVVLLAEPASDDSPAVPEHTTLKKCEKLSKGYLMLAKQLKKCRKLSKGYNKKNLALIAKYFKKIYKPTNNNLRTSSNFRNKNVDTTSGYKNDNQSRQFRSQRTVNVVGARENEYRKPKRVKDSAYHKEKMLLCKQAEKGVPLQAEQSDWLADTDEEINEQELEAHYSYMEKIQEVPTADSGIDSEPLEQVQYNDKYNEFANVNQHYEQSESTSNTCLVEKDDSDVTP